MVADPHRADRRGKRRDKEVEVKEQRAGQLDRRSESGHRQAGLAARPLICRTGALFSWTMAIQHSATPASGRAMRCGNGLEVRGCGTWMQMPATRWCLAIGTTTSCGWRAGAHVLLLTPYTSCYLRLIWVKLAWWVRLSAHFSVLCLSPWGPVLFVWQSAVPTAPSAAVKVSRAPAPEFSGAWRSELWRQYKLRAV